MDPQISRGFQLSGIEEPTFRRPVRRRVITASTGLKRSTNKLAWRAQGTLWDCQQKLGPGFCLDRNSKFDMDGPERCGGFVTLSD